MENLREKIPLEITQMSIYLVVEKAHEELCTLVEAHNQAIGAGDMTEAARIKDQMRDRGTVLFGHLNVICSSPELGESEAAMWQKYREGFKGYLALLEPKEGGGNDK